MGLLPAITSTISYAIPAGLVGLVLVRFELAVKARVQCIGIETVDLAARTLLQERAVFRNIYPTRSRTISFFLVHAQ